MTTDGQRHAFDELSTIAAACNGALSVREHDAVGHWLRVNVRASMDGVRRYGGGMPLGAVEDLEIWIPRNFPLESPWLFASHFGFADYAHVTGKNLCLYLDLDAQWSPSDGMFGFVDRMAQWFVDAAAGRLDPAGAPVHPPAPLALDYTTTQLLVRADIPPSDQRRLLWANLEPVEGDRVDVTHFHRFGPKRTERVAAVILANTGIRGSYESRLPALVDQLKEMGFSGNNIIKHLAEVAGLNPTGTPLIVIVGTLNRGGPRNRQHHLVAWELPEELSDRLRHLFDPRDEETDDHLKTLNDWAANESLRWMSVHEARTAVTQRRDSATSMTAFRDLRVEIWGCGALGGWIAEFVARAQPAQLVLRDRGRVGAGLVVRQPYGEADITKHKAETLAQRLEAIDPTLDVVFHTEDLIPPDSESRELGEVDIVIDATANRAVSALLENSVAFSHSPPIAASVVFDARAQRGAMFATRRITGFGPSYVARTALRELDGRDQYSQFVEAFWSPAGLEDLIQAEPGCSAPTFHGSAADTAGMAAALANLVADFIGDDAATRVDLVSAPALTTPTGSVRSFRASYDPPLCISANDGYLVH